jgi:dephospho-CoA kinase
LSLRKSNRLVVVRVVASDATRARRLAKRRPPVSQEELAFRLRDLPANALPAADYVICNDEEQQVFAEWEFCRLLSLLKLNDMPRRAA